MAIEFKPVPPEGHRYPPVLNPDGDPYPFCMVFDQDTMLAFADTATELCEVLIDGYDLIPEADITAATRDRLLSLVSVQVRVQAQINREHDLTVEATPEEQQVLEDTRDTPPTVTEWTSVVPLVLVDMFYAPVTDVPAPVGRPRNGDPENSNIIWLSAIDEIEYLRSLHRVGEIQFATLD